MSELVRLLQAALEREQSDQMRGNVLDLLQDLGYGFSDGLGEDVAEGLSDVMSQEGEGAFGQVLQSHLSFIQNYIRQRDAAAQPTA
jgi:hypothetical protein